MKTEREERLEAALHHARNAMSHPSACFPGELAYAVQHIDEVLFNDGLGETVNKVLEEMDNLSEAAELINKANSLLPSHSCRIVQHALEQYEEESRRKWHERARHTPDGESNL